MTNIAAMLSLDCRAGAGIVPRFVPGYGRLVLRR